MRRRTILITGASSGLGAEMARQFIAKGHDLALTARREDRLTALRESLLAAHPDRTVVTRRLDVTDHAQVFEVVRALDTELGGLDRIIVNAGIGVVNAKIGIVNARIGHREHLGARAWYARGARGRRGRR